MFTAILLVVLKFSCSFTPSSLAASLDAPHNDAFGSGCKNCHDMTAFDQPNLISPNGHIPQDIDDWLYSNICLGCHDGVTATKGHFHSSQVTSTKYGTWTVGCSVCHNQHTQDQDREFGSSFGRFIRKNIDLSKILDDAPPNGSPLAGKNGIKKVRLTSTTGSNSYADGEGNVDGICEVCHTQTSHFRNDGSYSGVGVHTGLKGSNCMQCHSPDQGLEPEYQCLDCHDNPAIPETNISRVSVNEQFGGSSHHVQRADSSILNTDCYQCHWEADSNGKVTMYHGATPESTIDLVIFGSSSRPAEGTYNIGTTAVAYVANGSRGQIENINSHCLSCHDEDTRGIDIFSDGKSPNFYAWDESSTGARDGSSISARYSQSGTTSWGKYSGSSFSPKSGVTKAFSAHGNAPANGGGNSITISNSFITAESWPDTRSNTAIVACFDCHNSHGSTISGTTSSYASGTPNGGILKNTLSGKGGYGMNYAPAPGGTDAARNQYNPGADLCFDCHLTENGGETPWGYNSTYGVAAPVKGFSDYERFGAQSLKKSHVGGHFGASTPLATGAGTPQINGLCTPCHDPHGVSLTLDQDYAVPMLKGTWMTSLYQFDSPPPVSGNMAGGGEWGSWKYMPRYHIDQNTFGGWNWSSTARITEPVETFAGLCIKCHPKSKIDPDSTTLWRHMDRVHETVQGWGSNTRHSFTCSKCHTPHATEKLPRLMITNCLDSRHKGRSRNNTNPTVIGSGEGWRDGILQGSGNGRYPGGGQGSMPGITGFGLGITCHASASTPDNNLWNKVTPWVDADNDDNFSYRINASSPLRDCDDNDPTIYRALDRSCDGDNDGIIDASAGGLDCDDNNSGIGYVQAICDIDNDGEIAQANGGHDCDDNDPAIGRADDGECDSDGDGGIDWTAGGTDCADHNGSYNQMAADGTCDGDGDGFADMTAGGTDCDDDDLNITEATDGSCDNDLDGFIDRTARFNDAGMDCDDDNAMVTAATDNTCDGDNDTFIDSSAGGTDCTDLNASIGEAPDGTCDGDGDGKIDTAANPSTDLGYDCDDDDPVVRNPIDGNCDSDGDGFLDPTAFGSDCNDLDATITEAADGTCDGDSDILIDASAGGTDCDDASSAIKAAPDSTCDGDSDGHFDWQAGGDDCQDDNPGFFAADGTCDGDNDSLMDLTAGGTDCDDNNPNVREAADATCDGDGDTFIDPSAGGTDCDDSNDAVGYVPATCDVDGDSFISAGYGGVDCLDTDPSVTWASDSTCDGDGDSYFDWTSGANDCDDNNGAVTPPCDLTGMSTGYAATTVTDSTADWKTDIFVGKAITYHVTQTSCVWLPVFSCTTTEHYATRTITGNTKNTITVDSSWGFSVFYTPKEYAITLN